MSNIGEKALKALKRMEYFVNEDMGIKTFKQSGWHIEGSGDYEIVKDTLLKYQELEKENAKNKQLEEDLGCPFDVVFSAQKNGIIFKTKIRNKEYELCSNDYSLSLDYIENVGWVFHIVDVDILVETLQLADHNKTWWVKK